VKKEFKKLNLHTEKGYLKRKHFQHLPLDYGTPARTGRQILAYPITTLANTATSKYDILGIVWRKDLRASPVL